MNSGSVRINFTSLSALVAQSGDLNGSNLVQELAEMTQSEDDFKQIFEKPLLLCKMPHRKKVSLGWLTSAKIRQGILLYTNISACSIFTENKFEYLEHETGMLIAPVGVTSMRVNSLEPGKVESNLKVT